MIFIDHRGFSFPASSEATYTLDDVVEDLEGCRKALGLNRISLLGHSGHGFMALTYANKYPDYVESIILSNLAPTNSVERQKASIAYFESNADAERKAYFYQQFAKAQHMLKTEPTKRFTHLNIGMQAHSFYNYKYDYLVAPTNLWAAYLDKYPQINYYVFEYSAHYPMLEEAPLFLKKLLECMN